MIGQQSSPRSDVLDWAEQLGGGFSRVEFEALWELSEALPDGATVIQLGCYRGASCCVSLHAANAKRLRLIAVDCFDIPGIATMNAMPAVTVAEFRSNIFQFVEPQHTIEILRADTRSLKVLPTAELILVDASHHMPYVLHDGTLAKSLVSPDGTILFHDYGAKTWPGVKSAVDFLFSRNIVATRGTLACVRLGLGYVPDETERVSGFF